MILVLHNDDFNGAIETTDGAKVQKLLLPRPTEDPRDPLVSGA